MNRQSADFEITGRGGDAIALVEVKNLPRLTLATADDLRRDFLEVDETASSLFFLIISQDRAYLWNPQRSNTGTPQSVIDFPMREILREYISDKELNQHLRGAELEIAIAQWLSDLARGRAVPPAGNRALESFAQSLRGAEIRGGPRL